MNYGNYVNHHLKYKSVRKIRKHVGKIDSDGDGARYVNDSKNRRKKSIFRNPGYEISSEIRKMIMTI